MPKRINLMISDLAHDNFVKIKNFNNIKTQDEAMDLLLSSLNKEYKIAGSKNGKK